MVCRANKNVLQRRRSKFLLCLLLEIGIDEPELNGKTAKLNGRG